VAGVLILLVLLGLLGFFLRRRKRALGKGSWADEKTHHDPVPIAASTSRSTARPLLNSDNDAPEAAALIFREPPKDDEGMIRIFKGVDGRITDHVLNFYIAQNTPTYQSELARIPRDIRKNLELHVSRLDHLVTSEKSRVYALRAVVAGLVLRTVSEGSFFTDKNGGSLTPSPNTASDLDPYEDSRERTVLKLAEIVHEQLRPFIAGSASDEVRLRNLEDVARSVAEFATQVERQPLDWTLIWNTGTADLGKFDADLMEVAVEIPRSSGETPKIRGVVFPGLKREATDGELVLQKMQVLMY